MEAAASSDSRCAESLGSRDGIRGALLSDPLQRRPCLAQLLNDSFAGRHGLGQPGLVLPLPLGEVRGGRFHSGRVLPFSVRERPFERSVRSRSLRQLRGVLGMLLRESRLRRSHLRRVSLLGVAKRCFSVQQVLPGRAQGLLEGLARPDSLSEPGVELHLPLGGVLCRG